MHTRVEGEPVRVARELGVRRHRPCFVVGDEDCFCGSGRNGVVHMDLAADTARLEAVDDAYGRHA
jgi:hypothetical protein